jgi:hypothetical protein
MILFKFEQITHRPRFARQNKPPMNASFCFCVWVSKSAASTVQNVHFVLGQQFSPFCFTVLPNQASKDVEWLNFELSFSIPPSVIVVKNKKAIIKKRKIHLGTHKKQKQKKNRVSCIAGHNMCKAHSRLFVFGTCSNSGGLQIESGDPLSSSTNRGYEAST